MKNGGKKGLSELPVYEALMNAAQDCAAHRSGITVHMNGKSSGTTAGPMAVGST